MLEMSSRSQMRNDTVERGRMLVERAKKQTDKKDELLSQAKPQFEQAVKVFEGLHDDLRKKLEAIPQILDEKKQSKLVEQRDRWRSDYLQAQLLAAAAQEELADALKPGSKEHTDALTKAAKEFGEIYKKYRTRIAGLYARQYQARCLLKIEGVKDGKNVKEAVGYLSEVLGTPDSAPEIRELKMKTYLLATKAWVDAGQAAEAVAKGTAWLDDVRPNEQRDPDLQQIRVNVAEACLKYTAELKAKDPNNKEIRPILKQGREYVVLAAKYADGAVKRKATELIPLFGGAGDDGVATADKDPKNFQEAFDFGKEAIDSIPAAQSVLRLIPPRIKVETDAKVREELQQQVKEAQETLDTAKDRALKYFNLALRKATDETSADELNTVRYFLCYLNYDAGHYFDSLALGEFLAFRYPESAGARQGALIAMASCQKLYAEEKGENKDFESERIQKIAQYIVEKWPEQKEAEEALNTLIPFLIRAGRIADAEKYVAQIPESSSYRGMAELKTGQALWANYLLGLKDVRDLETEAAQWEKEGYPEGKTAASVKEEVEKLKAPLETLKKRAEQTLADGVKRMQAAGQVNAIVASATLSLAQIYVDTNQADKAVALLEDPKIGALTLVKKNDESTSREGFAEEIYKTALRAYISSLATAKNADATVGQAKEMMAALEQKMGTTPEGQQKLVMSYVGVAKDLQTQLDIASDDTTRSNLAKGFAAFLQQVGKEATDYNILNWVGETFRRMGDSLGRDKATNKPTPEAKAYYAQAVETFQGILDKAEKNPKFLPSENMKTALQRQLAVTYRDVGDFVNASNTFKEILSANPGLINVQMDAAYNYQTWAGASNDPKIVKMYEFAVGGWTDPKTRKRVVWGWRDMANKIASDSRFEEQFYEARYNLAFCRFKYGLAQKDKDLREKVVNLARLDVELTAKLFPELGGPEWRTKFDKLLKNIQRELGDKAPRGLAAVAVDNAATGAKNSQN
jgi:tetratricopeptide (TPR) repeat protein